MTESKSEILNSKVNVKKYFLPVYVAWALIIPTFLVFLNGYTLAPVGESFMDYITWKHVPAMYALYGFAYPLTIVTFEGFYISFTKVLGFDGLGAVWAGLSQGGTVKDNAVKSLIAVFILSILWLGPLTHLVLAFVYHKKYVEKHYNKSIKWSDYLFGFI